MRHSTLNKAEFDPPRDGWYYWAEFHTRNGDAIEANFLPLPANGVLEFGFSGGMEAAVVKLDAGRRRVSLTTAEWNRAQPIAAGRFSLSKRRLHVLRIEKTAGRGNLVKLADLRVLLDGEVILRAENLNLLPEMGVALDASGVRVRRVVHRGPSPGIPHVLHVGGWQMPNNDVIAENLESICRGIRQAAETGVQLLVTPETSLAGLFPTHGASTGMKRGLRRQRGGCRKLSPE